MMTTLVCSKCGDPVVVTSRSVALPFVCLKCEGAVEEFAADVEKAELATNEALAAPAPADPYGLTDEFATVENTTMLIADLEAQLTAAKGSIAQLQEKNDAQRRIIESLTNAACQFQQQLEVAKHDRDAQELVITAANQNLDELSAKSEDHLHAFEEERQKADDRLVEINQLDRRVSAYMEQAQNADVAYQGAMKVNNFLYLVIDALARRLRDAKTAEALHRACIEIMSDTNAKQLDEIRQLKTRVTNLGECRDFWIKETKQREYELLQSQRSWYVKLCDWCRNNITR